MVFKVAIPGKIQFKMYRKEPGFFLTRQGDIHYIGGSNNILIGSKDIRKQQFVAVITREWEWRI